MRIETALRDENPETPALVKRDERHIRWAEAEAQTAEVGPSPGIPVTAENGPRRGGDDLTDDEDQVDHSATPVLKSAYDMEVEEHHVSAAAESRPAARQREPAVDEDDLPLGDEEDFRLEAQAPRATVHQKFPN